MAKPTVSTDVGDIETIFKKWNCGIVVPSQNPKAMGEAIIKLADNPERLSDLAKASRTTAKKQFDISICVKNHFKIYSKIVGIDVK